MTFPPEISMVLRVIVSIALAYNVIYFSMKI